LFIWCIHFYFIGNFRMSLHKRRGPMSSQELIEQRELRKQLQERIKQLRMLEYIDDDEEPDVFIGEGI